MKLLKQHAVLITLFLSILILIPSSLAQFYQKEEWKRSLLESFFGALPNACYAFDPICFKCIVYMKILPMIFFFLVFFLLLYLIIWEVAANRPSSPLEIITGQTGGKKMTQREVKISAMLALVLSITLLHYGSPEFAVRQLNIWMAIFLFVGTFLIFTGMGRATFATYLVQAIVLILMLLLFSSYWNAAINPQINEIISECMGGV